MKALLLPQGRLGRSAFIARVAAALLGLLGCGLLLGCMALQLGGAGEDPVQRLLDHLLLGWTVALPPAAWFVIMQAAKRLHDLGRSEHYACWMLLAWSIFLLAPEGAGFLIPRLLALLFLLLAVAALLLLPGEAGPNAYGPDPRDAATVARSAAA